jgi:hypothetical protein
MLKDYDCAKIASCRIATFIEKRRAVIQWIPMKKDQSRLLSIGLIALSVSVILLACETLSIRRELAPDQHRPQSQVDPIGWAPNKVD